MDSLYKEILPSPKMQLKNTIVLLVSFFFFNFSVAQSNLTFDSVSLSAAKFRSIGPAFMTGRIADVVIDPADENHWYVGVGSGGVWETKNSGVTFNPIFDGQSVYSIGCITLDPASRNLWVGTGENVGGRHISFGDGIYLSKDGGKSWKNMGLKKSNHISKIIVHPTNSDIVWVAAQGPLWSKGGERGVFMTEDGGENWKQVLGDKEWTGATDLLIDPRNPEVLYAATWQRHRTVAAYLGGGPKTGIHKSTDGGKTWEKLKTGLPNEKLGKIGLAISPINPDMIYAAIELEMKKGGFYRSTDRGMSWEKRSDIISGGTGPHYYQEIWASPHRFGRVYFANNYLKVTNDGGKTFTGVGKQYKHVDNHAITFKANDEDYLLVGTDGGLYESFDLAKTWRQMGNLPITQYYKLAIDDSKPFYKIYGGTQDNNTQGGVSNTVNKAGISTADWHVVLGGDGHQPATEPGNPNIVYAQSQQGWYSRLDMQTGERIGIRPQPADGEGFERYNWDAPILVSSHNPARIFVASQRLWMSEDRGDSWKTLSEDLTRNEERFDLPIMGKKQSINNAWDVYAMSTYNTITSIAESPLDEQFLYVGTDDGYIQYSENRGASWSKIDVSSLGVPSRTYINDIKADLFDAKTAYAALDAHKQGDYSPYLYKTTDGGKTWKSITANLPEKHYVWRIVQDHVDPNLLFIGTEFGIWATTNGGKSWKQLETGLPTISFRDLAIHKGENDLVAASFGRGFYILDDYSFLRDLDKQTLAKQAALFPISDAHLYYPKNDGRQKSGSLGGQHFYGENQPFGALISYYVKEVDETAEALRKKEEKEKDKQNEDVSFPGWSSLDAEKVELKSEYWLIIKDERGSIVRKMNVPAKKGVNRITWNLKYANPYPIGLNQTYKEDRNNGFYVNEGKYSASLIRLDSGIVTTLSDPQSFEVRRLFEHTLEAKSEDERASFKDAYILAQSSRAILMQEYNKLKKQTSQLEVAMKRSLSSFGEEAKQLIQINLELNEMDRVLRGGATKNQLGEKTEPLLNDRLGAAGAPLWGSSYGPTQTAKDNLAIANKLMTEYSTQVNDLKTQLNRIKSSLQEEGLPVLLD